MSARSDLMNGRERKSLNRLAIIAVLALILGFVLSLSQRSAYLRAKDVHERSRESYLAIDGSLEKVKIERAKWDEASEDIDFFRSRFMYNDEDGINALRLDLEKIFDQAGLRVRDISYNYAELEKGRVKKIVATFNYSGSYPNFKKLLGIIERFPKFLTVEKLDFTDTGTVSGILRVRLMLAGYYGI